MFIKIDFLCRTNVPLNFIIKYIKLNQITFFFSFTFLGLCHCFCYVYFYCFQLYFHLKLILYYKYSQNLYLFFWFSFLLSSLDIFLEPLSWQKVLLFISWGFQRKITCSCFVLSLCVSMFYSINNILLLL